MLGELIEAIVVEDKDLEGLGLKVGKLYTDHGLPIDMALDRLHLPQHRKLIVLHGVCQWLIEHRRQSGATDKSIERQRIANQRMIKDFIESGETGAY